MGKFTFYGHQCAETGRSGITTSQDHPGSDPPHTGDGEKRKKWGNKHHSPGEVLLKRREKPKSPPTGLYCSWGWEF